MFHADAALALELIALAAGFWILLKIRSAEIGNLKGLGIVIGYLVIVLSFVALLCTGYYALRYWEDGHFRHPYQGHAQMMPGHQGMGMGMMPGCGQYGKMGPKMGSHEAGCGGHGWKGAGKAPGDMHQGMEKQMRMEDHQGKTPPPGKPGS